MILLSLKRELEFWLFQSLHGITVSSFMDRKSYFKLHTEPCHTDSFKSLVFQDRVEMNHIWSSGKHSNKRSFPNDNGRLQGGGGGGVVWLLIT